MHTLLTDLLTGLIFTDDLLPSIPISCLPLRRMDPEVLRLDINCSQPGGSPPSLLVVADSHAVQRRRHLSLIPQNLHNL